MTRATVLRNPTLDANGHVVKVDGVPEGTIVKEVLRFRDETPEGGDGFVEVKVEPLEE